MRGISVCVALIALTLGAAFGDPPTKESATAPQVEDLIANALLTSPEIQLAENKVREAELELRRKKMQLAANIVSARIKVDASQRLFIVSQKEFEAQKALKAKNATPDTDYRRAEAQMTQAKLSLAEAEAQLDSSTGASAQKLGIAGKMTEHRYSVPLAAGPTDSDSDGRVVRPPNPAMAERIRKALDTPVRAGEMKETPLGDVLNYYRDLSKEVPIVIAIGERTGDPISLTLNKELPLGSHLQALQDLAPGLVVSVRDYGILVTYNNQPDDAISFLDFWHGKAKRETPK